jgi:hypothetical protein
MDENDALKAEVARLTAERDAARRLLKSVVDMMRDNMPSNATHPKHLCDFTYRPDIAMCKVCEDFTDAIAMIYPNEFEEAKP